MIRQNQDLQEAISRLKTGQLVAIPTETVYGLAAPIEDEDALKQVFTIKERPAFDPLIVHIASKEKARDLVTQWPRAADLLADKFWPGPLTLVLPKSEKVSSLITSGLPTVAIRVPRHPITLALLEQLNCGLAAPSANRFGKTSPTLAEHVKSEFPDDRVFVLDGGPTDVGIESTIVKVDESAGTTVISLLRPGMISLDEISEFLNSERLAHSIEKPNDNKEAPGHLLQHYMPDIPLILVTSPNRNSVDLESASKKLNRSLNNTKELKLNDDPFIAARTLYADMRVASSSGADCILCFIDSTKHKGPYWEPILDRLGRAASIDLR